LSYSYESEKRQVLLTVKQTQKVEAAWPLPRPVEIEITTASGPKLYNVTVSKTSRLSPARGFFSADGSVR